MWESCKESAYAIGMKFHFSKQLIYITNNLLLYLTNTTFLFAFYPLIAFFLPSSCHCHYLLNYDIYTSFHNWQNQVRSHEYISKDYIANKIKQKTSASKLIWEAIKISQDVKYEHIPLYILPLKVWLYKLL